MIIYDYEAIGCLCLFIFILVVYKIFRETKYLKYDDGNATPLSDFCLVLSIFTFAAVFVLSLSTLWQVDQHNYYATKLTINELCILNEAHESKFINNVTIEKGYKGFEDIYLVRVGWRLHDSDEAKEFLKETGVPLYKNVRELMGCDE